VSKAYKEGYGLICPKLYTEKKNYHGCPCYTHHTAHSALFVIPQTILITACFNSGVAALTTNKSVALLTVKKYRRNFRSERLTRGGKGIAGDGKGRGRGREGRIRQ
jgi:hypothetical protein